jgi:hypothetical protein
MISRSGSGSLWTAAPPSVDAKTHADHSPRRTAASASENVVPSFPGHSTPPLRLSRDEVAYHYDAWGHLLERAHYRLPQPEGTLALVKRERYAYDGLHVWADLNGADQLELRYLRGNAVDALFARIDYTARVRVADPQGVLWYLTDRQGSVLGLVDNRPGQVGGGVLAHRIQYAGFGVRAAEWNTPGVERHGYTGRAYDPVTELQFNRRRWYDPATKMLMLGWVLVQMHIGCTCI